MSQIDDVEGWLSNSTALYSHALMKYQTEQSIIGNICEIGVHHGRYFLALALGLRDDERAVAIDLFEEQEQNIDNSGRGDKDIFLSNFDKFMNRSQLDIITGNSLRITSAMINSHGLVRFFSIDGGHDENTTANDLRLAERSILRDGIVALDDILSSHWTGVISGLVRYLREGGSLQPMVLVPNKLFLGFPESFDRYRTYMREEFKDTLQLMDREFFGSTVDVFGERSVKNSVADQNRYDIDTNKLEAEAAQLRAENALLKSELADLMSSRRYRLGASIASIYNAVRSRT
ncbi:class I SAM-dependent methyltransferase [Phreatobacter sp. AB_2022a]|uniref:class I SAM-dependent methyltransferase n=1 Tax=Phreatobacter sp. AB_2022a TaxID=3003134 RepID=UPI0022874CCC|nr:class I SAM-dependent methyltransferase [Phreatobacter sp. AB_2022a]MCZ0736175.1 class I SAM-dependent methyltransferase [Phreatobacter sp. AB_2022a]